MSNTHLERDESGGEYNKTNIKKIHNPFFKTDAGPKFKNRSNRRKVVHLA